MTNTAAAAALRAFLKSQKIAARVHCGRGGMVYVETPTFEADFSEADQIAFCSEAQRLGLTHARRLPIRVGDGTYTRGGVFFA